MKALLKDMLLMDKDIFLYSKMKKTLSYCSLFSVVYCNCDKSNQVNYQVQAAVTEV